LVFVTKLSGVFVRFRAPLRANRDLRSVVEIITILHSSPTVFPLTRMSLMTPTKSIHDSSSIAVHMHVFISHPFRPIDKKNICVQKIM
jgi:hypothetical protein